jgi:hypothetical protein
MQSKLSSEIKTKMAILSGLLTKRKEMESPLPSDDLTLKRVKVSQSDPGKVMKITNYFQIKTSPIENAATKSDFLEIMANKPSPNAEITNHSHTPLISTASPVISPDVYNHVPDDDDNVFAPNYGKPALQVIECVGPAIHEDEVKEQEDEISFSEIDEEYKDILRKNVHWKSEFRKLVSEKLNKVGISVANVYKEYQGRIPMRTLHFWKKNPVRKPSGRKPLFPELDDELFEWFVLCRVRGLEVTDRSLLLKAKKISERLADIARQSRDNDMEKLYSKFMGSRGYLWRFKRRYKIVRRSINTRIKFPYDTLKTSVSSLKPALSNNNLGCGVLLEFR